MSATARSATTAVSCATPSAVAKSTSKRTRRSSTSACTCATFAENFLPWSGRGWRATTSACTSLWCRRHRLKKTLTWVLTTRNQILCIIQMTNYQVLDSPAMRASANSILSKNLMLTDNKSTRKITPGSPQRSKRFKILGHKWILVPFQSFQFPNAKILRSQTNRRQNLWLK